jgi:hypothetical protein
MDRVEIVVPGPNGKADFSGFLAKQASDQKNGQNN